MQGIPPLHPLVEGLHGIFFRGVRFGAYLFNGGFFFPFVSCLLASRQRQGGQDRRCRWK